MMNLHCSFMYLMKSYLDLNLPTSSLGRCIVVSAWAYSTIGVSVVCERVLTFKVTIIITSAAIVFNS